MRLLANDTERGALQRLDETAGIADGHHILHPAALVAAADELHDPRVAQLRVFPAKLEFGVAVGDEPGAVDIAAVDAKVVLDLPRPSCVQRLGGRVRLDRLIRPPRPAPPDGPVAKEAGLEAHERLRQRLAGKEREETRAGD